MGKSHAAGWVSDSPTPAQLKEFFAQIASGRITKKGLQGFLRGIDRAILTDWEVFWNRIDGKDHNFSNVVIPEKPEGNWRLLIIADATLEVIYTKCRECFYVWSWEDFNEIFIRNERDAKSGPYAIWVRNEVEADKNLKHKSADAIRKMEIATETLAERFVHELKLFEETGKYLDVKKITLCTGSRDSDGRVPFVDGRSILCKDSRGSGGKVPFFDSKVHVNWCSSAYISGELRSRQVVSS